MTAHAGVPVEVRADSLRPGAEESRGSTSVMVIDDDDELRFAVTQVLHDAGYHVQHASNGREALQQLEGSRTPDLIVLDLVMPLMDGWEFRLEQRRRPSLANVPVLVLSADRSSKARAIDADAYLAKPLDEKSFLHAVELGLLASERRKLEQRAAELDRLGSIGVLAAGIAHEINNPLAVVAGNMARAAQLLDIARDAQPTPALEQAFTLLAQAREGADRIASVVRAVATFSHPLDTRTSAVDLCGVLEASLRLVANEARHRAQLTSAINGPLHVLGNAAQLGQVFVNLLTNAIRAIDEGDPARNAIHVTALRQRGGRVVVEVSDTGRGIRPEHVGRVFDPFFTTGAVGEGMGLGLSVSQRLVAAAGGVITVQSTLGHGSCFRVELPSCLPPRADSLPSPVRSGEPRADRRPRVLIIDDEVLLCQMLAGMLDEQCDVAWYSDPRAALEAIHQDGRWDVILSDVMMPELSGMDLYAEVARRQPALAPRFVFMTGGTFTPRAQGFLETLPQEPLEKPFGRAALLARIARVTDQLESAESLAQGSVK